MCVLRKFPASSVWFQQSQQLSELQQMLALLLEPRKASITIDTCLVSVPPGSLFLAIVLFSFSQQLSATSAQQRMRRRPPSLAHWSAFSHSLYTETQHEHWVQKQQNCTVYLEFKHLTLRCQRANPPAKSKPVSVHAFFQWMMLFPITLKEVWIS